MLENRLIQFEQGDFKAIFTHPENEKLLDVLRSFSQVLKRYGYKVEPYSKSALLKLNDISFEKKENIRCFFENWANWIAPDCENDDVIKITIEKEKMFLKRALDHYGFWLHDSFWITLEEGQLIEFYGPDFIQLYRNLKFFDYCSYSLLDISVFEFYNLWERSALMMNLILEHANKVLTVATPVLPIIAPKHILREVKPVEASHDLPRMASLVEFKNVGSLFKSVNPAPAGVICTSLAQVIASGVDADSIHFV